LEAFSGFWKLSRLLDAFKAFGSFQGFGSSQGFWKLSMDCKEKIFSTAFYTDLEWIWKGTIIYGLLGVM